MRCTRWIAALAAGGMLLAACSSSSNNSSGSASSTGSSSAATTTTVKLTGPPVTLMVMYEGSGSVSTPEVPDGAKAAAEAINRAGGIDGSPIDLINCDLGNDANKARECGQQAVDKKVAAVVGPVSANSGEYMPLLEAAQIPVVGNVPASAADFTSVVSFPLYGGIVTASAGLADALVSKGGATKVSVARIDLAAAAAIKIFADKSLSRNGGATVNDVSIPVGAPDMATYVASVLQGGTDGVLVGLAGQDATNFIIQLRQTNPNIPVSATTTDFDAVIKALGPAADGIYATGFFDDATTDPTSFKQYTDDLAAVGVTETGGFRTNSYSAVQAVAKVLTGAPDKSGPALLAALGKVTGLQLPLLPKLQFTQGGGGGIPRVFNTCGTYRQLKDGQFTTISSGFIDMFTGAPC
jgi:branched-chain amino acid transport system substrate-binding protein